MRSLRLPFTAPVGTPVVAVTGYGAHAAARATPPRTNVAEPDAGSVPLVAHLVGRGPRLSGIVSGQRSSHPADLDGIGLLARPDLTIGVFGGQEVELVDGGFVVG